MSAKKPWLHDRTCAQCPAPITRQSKTGLCRSCVSKRAWSDQNARERRIAAARAACSTPEALARRAAVTREWMAARRDDPAWQAHMIESARHMRSFVTEATFDKIRATRAEATARMVAAKMAWCPPQYRAYDDKLRAERFTLAERKVLVADLAALDERRRLAALTPFERQLERARIAGISERVAMPSRVHGFSLTGGSLS